jgi:uncharacterized protein (TIGR03437 family)
MMLQAAFDLRNLAAAVLMMSPALYGSSTLPLEFESNAGQFDPAVLYLARTSNHYVYLSRHGMTLGLSNAAQRNSALRMSFSDASVPTRIAGEARTSAVSNYLIGNEPAQWRHGVPHYASVRYSEVWPGIDLVFHGRNQSLEYDFLVSPGRAPSTIRLRYDNAISLRVDANGDLLVRTTYGEVRQQRPEIYQLIDGTRRAVNGRYRILSGHEIGFDVSRYDRTRTLVIDPVLTYSTYMAGTGTAKLNAMALDSTGNVYLTGKISSPDFPLVGTSAPAATGIGLYRSTNGTWSQTGNGAGTTKILALAADPKNNATVYAGTSRGVFKTSDGGLTWKATTGLPADAVNALAVDATNSTVYVASNEGLFQSPDGGSTWTQLLTSPVTSVVSAATRPGLIYAGRIAAPILRSFDSGASWQEVGTAVTTNGLAIDPTNSQTVYAATARSGFYVSTDNGNNWTFSNTGIANGNNPLTVNVVAIDPRIPLRLYAGTTAGLFRSADGGAGWTPAGTGVGTRNVLSISINPVDATVVYAGTAGGGVFRSSDGGDTWTSTGPANLDANAVAVDSAGQFVHTGLWIGTQAFVSKLNATGTALAYSTYIGGTGVSEGHAITVDPTGRAVVCGATDAADFPSRNAYQPAIGGSRDAFFLRLNPAGSDLDYSGFLGGRGDDVCEGIALDSNGNLYLAGNTYTTASGASANNFPTSSGAFQRSSPGGGQDCFVTKLDNTAQRLTYSTYFGGSGTDTCVGLVLDSGGYVYLAGTTKSPNIPLNQPSFGTIPSPPILRYSTGFVTRLQADASDINYSVLLGSSTADTEIDSLALDALGRVHVTGFTRANDFPTTANALGTLGQQGKTFVSVVDPNFNKLVYSTLLPGSGADAGWRIQPDVFGNPWIIGNAYTGSFPVTADALTHTGAANPTPYALQLDISASKLLHSTLLAGNAGGTAGALAVATNGTVYAAGSTLSTDFPVQGGPFQSAKTNDYAIFVQHIDFSQSTTTPPPPTPVVSSVVNGASFVRGISPGAAIAIFGTNLGDSSNPGATTVSVDGKNIPLFYVSATQINAQMPYETTASTPTLRVTVSGVSSTPGSITVDPATPGVFFNPPNRAAVTNADNSLNTAGNPAAAGSAITIYFTGIGPLDNPVATGVPAPLDGPLSRATLPVRVTIGGQPANQMYVGLTPGSIALAQANVVVPDLSPGDYPVTIAIGTFVSNGPVISVTGR